MSPSSCPSQHQGHQCERSEKKHAPHGDNGQEQQKQYACKIEFHASSRHAGRTLALLFNPHCLLAGPVQDVKFVPKRSPTRFSFQRLN